MFRALESKRGVEVGLAIWLIWFAAACIEVVFDPFNWMATWSTMKPGCVEQLHQIRSVGEGIHLMTAAACETPMTIGVAHHVSSFGLIVFALIWLRAKARFDTMHKGCRKIGTGEQQRL